MTNRIFSIFFVLGIIFVIQYEGYNWDPCSGNVCLAIGCPPGGCYTPAKTIWCEDVECVEKELNEYGIEHLDGVYRVNLSENRAVTKMVVEKSFTIREPEKE